MRRVRKKKSKKIIMLDFVRFVILVYMNIKANF